MRKQYINKKEYAGKNIYMQCNWENVNAEYYERQEFLYSKQKTLLKEITKTIEKFKRGEYTMFKTLYELKDHFVQLERMQEIKDMNTQLHNALEYFVGQNEGNEIIPEGMIFK